MDPMRSLARRFAKRARSKRAALFRSLFKLDRNTKLLDLGSEGGAHINAVLEGTPVEPANVYIADIDAEGVLRGSRKFGYTPVVIGEAQTLPFPERFFDIVFCSSVIEHVTVPKHQVWQLRSGRVFRHEARKRQQAFANEIRRLGKSYFVQTPYKHFPIESHSLLPFLAWLPRRVLIPTLRLVNPIWITQTAPDWHLLDRRQFAELFDAATIIEEKVLGLTKSLMAVSPVESSP